LIPGRIQTLRYEGPTPLEYLLSTEVLLECEMRFALLDEYTSILLGTDISRARPGKVCVVESPRRLTPRMSYGYVHALWFLWLSDGRRVVSVPPSAGNPVEALLRDFKREEAFWGEAVADRLRDPVDRALRSAGLSPTNRVFQDLVFAVNAHVLKCCPTGHCRRLVDASIPAAGGLGFPAHCFPDGTVYGVVIDGKVVSEAYAHRTGIMEDKVCDVGIETAGEYRRRGYAKAALSALVREFTGRGGEARYACSPSNHASIGTAQSVGFIPYAKSLILAAPRPTAEREMGDQ